MIYAKGKKPGAGDLNRKIGISAWVSSKDADTGIDEGAYGSATTTWAMIEHNKTSGEQELNERITYEAEMVATVRYKAAWNTPRIRVTDDYGDDWEVSRVIEIGYKEFLQLECYKHS